jgi:hypothetical protein
VGASVSTLEGCSRLRLHGNPADLSCVLEDTSPSDVRHCVPSDSLRREGPSDPIHFLGERLGHSGQEVAV